MSLHLQDFLAMLAVVSGPVGTLMAFMWHHSNTKFEKLDEKFEILRGDIHNVEKSLRADINGVEKRLEEKIDSVEKSLRADINGVEKRLGEKIDAVRDRVSRIEGQLAPASIVAFNPPRHKEPTRATHSS
jgi:hypothetical protein